MNKLCEPLGLRSPDGREAQLVSVQVHGEVLGLMLRLTVQQTWRNTSGAPMATRLAFALTPNQCLLDLQALRSGCSQAITHVARMNRDICHASFGVMNTGEQVTVQWRIGQLLNLEGGSLRLRLPAAIAPSALRPARLSLELHDPIARGTLGGTSHELQKVRHANGMTFKLTAPHGLERDLGVTLHGLRGTGFAVASPDLSGAGRYTVLTSHHLHMKSPSTPQRLRLKLAVDHTGAIGAERQLQIQLALERLLGSLQPGDQLACSRVGAALVHDLPRLQPCTEAYVRRARSLLRHTELTPGEPDWACALQTLVDLPDEDEEAVQDASILVVTAHPIMAIADALQALRARGHRLHVMTVGDVASQSLWTVLARDSGGSCETLGPGQHSQQTLQRLLDRMRCLRPVQVQLSVNGHNLGAVRHEHESMAEGDTLHLWAPFDPPQAQTDLAGCPEWHARMSWSASDETAMAQSTSPMPVIWDAEGDLSRICAARDAMLMPAGPERDLLIEGYRLVLPDERHMALAPVPAPAANPRQTDHPAAATPTPRPGVITSPVLQTARIHAIRRGTAPMAATSHPLATLVQQFNLQAPAYKQFRAALSATLQRAPTHTVNGLVMQLARQAGNPGRVWALLLHFLHTENELSLQDHALDLVEQELANVPLGLRNNINAALRLASFALPARQVA